MYIVVCLFCLYKLFIFLCAQCCCCCCSLVIVCVYVCACAKQKKMINESCLKNVCLLEWSDTQVIWLVRIYILAYVFFVAISEEFSYFILCKQFFLLRFIFCFLVFFVLARVAFLFDFFRCVFQLLLRKDIVENWYVHVCLYIK